MARALYVALVSVLLPVGTPLLLLASILRPRLRHGLGERLSLSLPARDVGGTVWIHAASLGEMKVALALSERLQPALLGRRVLLTTNTVAGCRVARDRGVRAWFAPIDHPAIVGRFLAAARPSLLVVVETEIWPGWLAALHRLGVPAVLVNGRLSLRASRRYAWIRSLMGESLASLAALLMRTEEDASRAMSLGAPAVRVRVLGDLKAALAAGRSPADGAALRERYGFGEGDPVVVAGSTDLGEEAIALRVWRELRGAFPDLRLIVAPRQPERFADAWRLVQNEDARARRVSDPPKERVPPCHVVLLDSVGDLSAHYAMATVAFVGGSFTDRGGQSLVEPAHCGCPVLYGPNVSNWTEIAALLENEGGGMRCSTPEVLQERLGELLADPAARERAGEGARRAIRPFLHVADATVAEIVGLLESTARHGARTRAPRPTGTGRQTS